MTAIDLGGGANLGNDERSAHRTDNGVNISSIRCAFRQFRPLKRAPYREMEAFDNDLKGLLGRGVGATVSENFIRRGQTKPISAKINVEFGASGIA
jgi:hypothetical protein